MSSRRLMSGKGRHPVAVGPPMSLALAAASSQYLSRTWGSLPTNDKIATLAFFIKHTTTPQGSVAVMYDGGNFNAAGAESAFRVIADGLAPEFVIWDGSAVTEQVTSTNLGRIVDTSTWHHYCVAYDSTAGAGTAADRLRIYLDGVEITYVTADYITLNGSYHLADNGIASAIGRCQVAAANYFNAKFAYFYFIDGQKLLPSSFITGTGAGTTRPIAYTGTFGANGFFLDFSNNAFDQSSNGNNWTMNNSPTFSSDIPGFPCVGTPGLHSPSPNNITTADWTISTNETRVYPTADPLGGSTASGLKTQVAGSDYDDFLQAVAPFTMYSGTVYTFSFYVKSITVPSWILVAASDGVANAAGSWFNVSGSGAVGSPYIVGTGVLNCGQIIPSTNGYVRISIGISLTTTNAAMKFSLYMVNGNGTFGSTLNQEIALWQICP